MNSKKDVFVVYLNNKRITKKKYKKDKVCPFCGYHYSDFKKIGFLGCPECYNAFYPQIIKFLKKIHRSIEYKGKIPVKHEDGKC